jgi:transcriptional regulator with XRE-family HTH domain
MQETAKLLATLKHALRARGLTYADVGEALGVAESSVKRLFSTGRFTLDRFERICKLAGLSVAELARESEAAQARPRQLTRAQEAELVADPRLLLVAVCVLNHIPAAAILDLYELNEAELVRCLTRLDSLGLIELQAGNRVRLAIDREFTWLPEGPIAQYFATELRADFLDPRHRAERQERFLHGLLTESALAELNERLASLRHDFARLHEASRRAPLESRSGQVLFLASGPWEPRGFEALRRKTKQ